MQIGRVLLFCCGVIELDYDDDDDDDDDDVLLFQPVLYTTPAGETKEDVRKLPASMEHVDRSRHELSKV
ncbi:hypothetical protein E2C01_016038 [Portunus trituberculatus]|uniref:Uncharacterized protein n=1 Tax=Portunus trituberculatus TaxID=210409 RepID=A0A5B7DP65_PORTR|nr:hypothetical protein [Portunus trituberculatus]